MRQYTPSFNRSPYPELNRKLTSFEYDEVVKFAVEIGLEGFTQEKGCESEEFTPNFKKVRWFGLPSLKKYAIIFIKKVNYNVFLVF